MEVRKPLHVIVSCWNIHRCVSVWMVNQNGHHGLTDEDSGHVDGCTGWRVCSSVMSDEVCRQAGKLVEGQDGVLVLVKERRVHSSIKHRKHGSGGLCDALCGVCTLSIRI